MGSSVPSLRPISQAPIRAITLLLGLLLLLAVVRC